MNKVLEVVSWVIPILIGTAVAIWARIEGNQWVQGAILGAAGVLIFVTIEHHWTKRRERYRRMVSRAIRNTTALHVGGDSNRGYTNVLLRASQPARDNRLMQRGTCIACWRSAVNQSPTAPALITVRSFGKRVAHSTNAGSSSAVDARRLSFGRGDRSEFLKDSFNKP